MPPSKGPLDGIYTGRRERGATARVLAGIGLTLAAIFCLFFGGEYIQRLLRYDAARTADPSLTPVRADEPLRDVALNTFFQVPRPLSSAALLESGLPIYDLRIEPEELRVLQQTAEKVTARNIATGVPREYVPAQFFMDGGWYPIRVKLRGLYDIHYLKTRPSLRLNFPTRRLFHGKKQINLSDPYDKGLTVDATTNWELAQHDVLTWESQFVVLRLNGGVVGVFQEIEQFGRSITDRNLRPEGFIFSGRGQLFGKEGTAYDKALAALDRVKGCQAVDSKRTLEHCDWSFLSEYFDTDRWAWAAAIAALLHSSHAWHPDNLRMFWDPARGKFEPIPWDYFRFAIDAELSPDGEARQSGYDTMLLGVPEFRRMRDRRLWTVLTERVDPMIEHSRSLFRDLEKALINDARHPNIEMDRSRQGEYERILKSNSGILRDLFQQHDLRAHVWPGPGGAKIELENRGKAFVRIAGISLSVGGATASRPIAAPAIVDGAWRGEPGSLRLWLPTPDGAEIVGLEATNEVTGAPLSDTEVRVAQAAGLPLPIADETGPSLPALGIVGMQVEPHRITFGPDRVHLDRTLEIPATHDVIFAPGLELEMEPGVSLIVYGDLTSLGQPDRPIRVAGSGGAKSFGGVFVQGTRVEPRRVRMEHTVFEGGAGGENQRTYFTGPFAVHDGVVWMRSNQFRNSTTDDGINLKYCEVDLENNLFLGSTDDAFDCDFCTGRVVDNRFVNSGGDGIDFSGSDLLVERNVVDHCGDKGVSVGESTRALLRENEVRDCHTGIAVKDLSDAHLVDNRVLRAELGLALYIKKPTFGPSRARVEGLHLEQVATDYVRDEACILEFAGRDAG